MYHYTCLEKTPSRRDITSRVSLPILVTSSRRGTISAGSFSSCLGRPEVARDIVTPDSDIEENLYGRLLGQSP